MLRFGCQLIGASAGDAKVDFRVAQVWLPAQWGTRWQRRGGISRCPGLAASSEVRALATPASLWRWPAAQQLRSQNVPRGATCQCDWAGVPWLKPSARFTNCSTLLEDERFHQQCPTFCSPAGDYTGPLPPRPQVSQQLLGKDGGHFATGKAAKCPQKLTMSFAGLVLKAWLQCSSRPACAVTSGKGLR